MKMDGAGAYDDGNSDSVNAYMFSNAAWIIPTVTGSVSTVSSILIISVILRSSQESRFTSYHIIMLFMSFWDAIASIGMALTTIPMPSDIQDVYPFSGKSFGNIGTCRAQGFLIFLGTIMVITSSCALNIYYLCAMRYNMAEDKIKRKVLPIMLVVCTLSSVVIAFVALKKDHFSPKPLKGFCTIGHEFYPTNTNCAIHDHDNDALEEDDNKNTTSDCFRWVPEDSEPASDGFIITTFVIVCFFVIVSSLVVLVFTFFKEELYIRRSMRITRRSRMVRRLRYSTNSRNSGTFSRTRAVLLQAFMYVTAFTLTHVWFLILFFVHVQTPGNGDGRLPKFHEYVVIAAWIFRPLQGFFNAMIFIYQKAYSLCRANRRRRLRLFPDAIKEVIISPSTVPTLLISGMEIAEANDNVDSHHANAAGNQRRLVDRRLSNQLIRRGRDSLIHRDQTPDDEGDNGADGTEIGIDTDDALSVLALSILESEISSCDGQNNNDDDRLMNMDELDDHFATASAYSGTRRLASVAEEDEDDCVDENDDYNDDLDVEDRE